MRTYNFTVEDRLYTIVAANFNHALTQLRQQLGL